MRVREREGYPLHCCVTGNLIERERAREREAGRQQGRREGGVERRAKERRNAKSTEREPLLLELQRTGTERGCC